MRLTSAQDGRQAPFGAACESTELSALRFLVVDDCPVTRCVVDGMLRQLGVHLIVEAEDGVDALATLENAKVDFIISDWNMPRMSGLDLLTEVRRGGRNQSTPFVMVSSEGSPTYLARAAQAGADGYLVKPLSPAAIDEKLRACLSKRKGLWLADPATASCPPASLPAST